MFSAIIVVLQFCHAWQAATVVAAVLCFFAGLEAFLNFCAGAAWWGGFVWVGNEKSGGLWGREVRLEAFLNFCAGK